MEMTPQQTPRLFLVCPICGMESYVRQHFGDGYFYTAPASVFHFDDPETIEALRETVFRNRIGEIIWVADSSCCFIQRVLENKPAELRCEHTIRSLYSPEDTALSITYKVMKHQMERLGAKDLFGAAISDGTIKVSSLITARHAQNLVTV
jgi:hypothetical protein